MKRFILLAVAATTLLAVCADRPRKNPLDPKNPDSKRDRAVLVELFTTDSAVYTQLDTLTPESSWTVTETLGVSAVLDSTTPGTTLTMIDSVVSDSTVYCTTMVIPKTLDTVTTNVNDSARITYYHDTLVTRLDTIQYYDSLEIRISDSYEAGAVIVAEYHLEDDYTFNAAGTLWSAYQAAAGAGKADTVAAVYFNGSGNPADLSDTTLTTATRYTHYAGTVAGLAGQTAYYSVEGYLSVTNTAIDSVTTHTTCTGSGKLARLGSADGDSITVRYIFTRYLNADHPYVVIGTVEDTYRLTAPEAGEIYTLPSRSITVPTAIGADYANIIVTVQDAATGEVLQTARGN